MVNYCQKLFSGVNGNGWSNNGCIICADSTLAYFAPGFAFTQNTTCVPTNTTRSKRSLRFLQSTTAAASTPAASGSTPAVTVFYSVCAVPNPICATDANGANLYNAILTQVTSGLKTLSTTTGNVPIQTTSSVTDVTAPVGASIVITGLTWQPTGAVTWTATYTTPIVCYYQITSATAPTTIGAIQACTDNTRCGVFRANSKGLTGAIPSTSLNPFTANTAFTMYYGCYNDIPYPQNPSTIQTAGAYTYVPTTTGSTNSTTTTPSTPASTSASKLTFSYLIFLCLLFILY